MYLHVIVDASDTKHPSLSSPHSVSVNLGRHHVRILCFASHYLSQSRPSHFFMRACFSLLSFRLKKKPKNQQFRCWVMFLFLFWNESCSQDRKCPQPLEVSKLINSPLPPVPHPPLPCSLFSKAPPYIFTLPLKKEENDSEDRFRNIDRKSVV